MKKKYEEAQLDLIRTLVHDRKCTVTQLVVLTGIPRGSALELVRRAGATFASEAKPGKSRAEKVREARKIVRLQAQYANELHELFGQKPAT